MSPAPTRIHHLALRVRDCERAAAFYAGVVGLTETRRRLVGNEVRSIWLSAGEVVLMLELSLRGGGAEAGSAHVLVFEARALGEWEARLASAGIAVVDRTEHTVYANDPDGHRVGFTVFGRPRP
jgi:glyoxylase I family protein